jgi:hypothetical protein
VPDNRKEYDVMVRVSYAYENMQGDTRKSWSTWIGTCKSSDPSTIPNWVASEVIELNPGEPIKRMLFTEISSHTITEVKNV